MDSITWFPTWEISEDFLSILGQNLTCWSHGVLLATGPTHIHLQRRNAIHREGEAGWEVGLCYTAGLLILTGLGLIVFLDLDSWMFYAMVDMQASKLGEVFQTMLEKTVKYCLVS